MGSFPYWTQGLRVYKIGATGACPPGTPFVKVRGVPPPADAYKRDMQQREQRGHQHQSSIMDCMNQSEDNTHKRCWQHTAMLITYTLSTGRSHLVRDFPFLCRLHREPNKGKNVMVDAHITSYTDNLNLDNTRAYHVVGRISFHTLWSWSSLTVVLDRASLLPSARRHGMRRWNASLDSSTR